MVATTLDKQLAYSHKQAFRNQFRDTYKDFTLTRTGTTGDFDPVTETYTGGDPDFVETAKGMFRKPSRRLKDQMNLTEEMVQVSVLQELLIDTSDDSSIIPQENDVVTRTDTGKSYRLVKYTNDVTNVYWHLFVKAV